jgi:methionyl-tRNA formyltransferase
VRGMNACEWSLLLDQAPAVSVHYIDRGIDTGPLVETIPLSVQSGATIGSLREQCAVVGIEGLRRNARALHEPIPARDPACASHKQVYTLAPALREILECRLRECRGVFRFDGHTAGERRQNGIE